MIRKLLSPETLCAFYLSMFSLLAPFTHTSEGNSTIILAGALVLVLGLQIILKKVTKVESDYSFFIKSTLVIGILFFVDYVFRPNADIGGIIYSSIIYVIFPLYFLSSISEYDKFIKSYCILNLICGIMMMKDPLQNYVWSGGYMPFGFSYMLPAFASSIILLFHYHNKLAIFPLAIFFLEMLIFANKGSILAGLILLFIGISYINNGNYLSKKVIYVSSFCLLLFSLFYKDLLELAIFIADKLGVNSYAITTILIILSNTSDNQVYDTRFYIWKNAITTFENNPILGCGIGYFSSHNDGYEHNLFLEVLNAWGIVGFIILAVVIYQCYRNYRIIQNLTLKVSVIVFAILGFVPLMSSLTLWIHTPFWVFLALCLKKDNDIDN